MKSWSIPNDVKQEAIQLRKEGVAFKNIGNYLGVSHTAVMNWVDRKNYSVAGKKYYLKNRPKRLAQMKKYHRRTHNLPTL
jgi:predicted transcriptional regulator